MHGRYELYIFSVDCMDVVSALELINKLASAHDATLARMQVDSNGEGTYEISFKADFSGRHASERMQKFFAALNNHSSITSVKSDRSRV